LLAKGGSINGLSVLFNRRFNNWGNLFSGGGGSGRRAAEAASAAAASAAAAAAASAPDTGKPAEAQDDATQQ